MMAEWHGIYYDERSPIVQVIERIKRVAKSEEPVLITGETGTGKEIFAKAVCAESERKDRTYKAINISDIPQTLLEAELFGSAKGSWTGCLADRKGLFEIVGAGTLLLDEIGDLDITLQPKLLRVLQEQAYFRVGDLQTKKDMKARLIFATNKNLSKMVKEGTFREDLYYRIGPLNVTIPPLRDRLCDIDILIDHILEQEKKGIIITKKARDILKKFTWSGNIRELIGNVRKLMCFTDEKNRVTPDIVRKEIASDSPSVKQENNYHTLSELISHLNIAQLLNNQTNHDYDSIRDGIERLILMESMAMCSNDVDAIVRLLSLRSRDRFKSMCARLSIPIEIKKRKK